MKLKVVGFITGFVLAVITAILILWVKRTYKTSKTPAVPERDIEIPAEPPAPSAAEKPGVMHSEDDLVIIEGIGPKVAEILKQNGIRTFDELAATPVTVLQKILRDNRLWFMKPDSWPEQGCLAAAGQMDELKALQEKLVAGR